MAEPILLAYNLDAGTASRLKALCQRQQIRYRPVTALEYGVPIGALAGIPVRARAAAAPVSGFSDPMLVMCHMLSPQLDAFLQGMRADGIPRIALKAVLTPANVSWDSRQLRDELTREHEAVQKR